MSTRSHIIKKLSDDWYKGIYCHFDGYLEKVGAQPEWICKILNGEKPIEVRRKVLKGMMD